MSSSSQSLIRAPRGQLCVLHLYGLLWGTDIDELMLIPTRLISGTYLEVSGKQDICSVLFLRTKKLLLIPQTDLRHGHMKWAIAQPGFAPVSLRASVTRNECPPGSPRVSMASSPTVCNIRPSSWRGPSVASSPPHQHC